MPSLSGWSWPAIAKLQGGSTREAILFRMASHPVVRLWAGVGDLALDGDNIETTPGALYQGMGALVGLPALSQLLNGVAERVEFTLSGAGISAALAALASSEAWAARNREINVGLIVLDDNWQRLSPVLWLWAGRADVVQVARGTDGGGQGGAAATATRALSLSVASLMSGRRRPNLSYFTDSDQRRRSPDDSFFDRVALYSRGSTKVWPS